MEQFHFKKGVEVRTKNKFFLMRSDPEMYFHKRSQAERRRDRLVEKMKYRVLLSNYIILGVLRMMAVLTSILIGLLLAAGLTVLAEHHNASTKIGVVSGLMIVCCLLWSWEFAGMAVTTKFDNLRVKHRNKFY